MTGVVTVAGGLDYESRASHTIVVRATSSDASFSTAAFTILGRRRQRAPAISAIAGPGDRRRRHHRPAHLHHLRPRDSGGLADPDGVSSSNTALVPNGNLVLGGSGASRTITVTPLANAYGTTTVTLRVSDGVNLFDQTFTVTRRTGGGHAHA